MTDGIPEPQLQPAILGSDAQLERVASVVGDIDATKVAAVIAAWHAIHDGDQLGTVRRDPVTGAVAVRVEDHGIYLWRVSTPQGEQYNDLQPSLPWPEM